MTQGSNHAPLPPRRVPERNCCTAYRQQKPTPKQISNFPGSRTKEQKYPKKSLCLRSYLKFCLRGREKREQREPQMDSLTEGTEGRLRELASKWFIETQVPFIVHNGFFPSWFLGFISRKDAEEILKEKELGCFLIRLSDKAIGYILSYRGRDRCRHFVINQSETGQFSVSGDFNRYDSVSDLIEYYKISPIQPFGEYLTSSCFQGLNEDLYDIIQVGPKEKPASAAKAGKTVQRQHTNAASEKASMRPTRSSRTPEEVPPLPRRSRHFDGAPLNDQDRVLYAQLMKQAPREVPRYQNLSQDSLLGSNPREAQWSTTLKQKQIGRCSPPPIPESNYSELSLLEGNKSKSLPLLDSMSDRQQHYRLSAPPSTPPRLSPTPNRQATGGLPRSDKMDSYNRQSSSPSLDYNNESSFYHLAGSLHELSEPRPTTSGQHRSSLYAEVSTDAGFPSDNTYELIPGHEDAGRPTANGNTYEPLEDVRHKPSKSENGKWKWLFPDAKKKR